MGYAVVSSQPGRSANQKRLMAIRSARMAAMRDLAEQIHGLKVEGNTTVIDLMVQNDTFRGIVSGTIRGARTVRIRMVMRSGVHRDENPNPTLKVWGNKNPTRRMWGTRIPHLGCGE